MSAINDLHQALLPQLQGLEDFRLEKQAELAKNKKLYFIPAAVVVGAVLAGLSGVILEVVIGLIILSVVLLGLIYGFKINPIHKRFKTEFKEGALSGLIESLYPGTEYDPERHIPKEVFKSSQLYSGFNSYNGEDYFHGSLDNGCTFEFSEIHAVYRSKDSTRTIFKGLFFVIDTPSSLNARVKILSDSAERSMGNFGKMLQSTVGSWGRKGAKMVYFEDYPNFEKEYVVYSDNEGLARGLITPVMADFLYELHQRWNEHLQVGFIDQKIFLGLPYQVNLLEPNIKKSATDYEFFKRIVDELAPGFSMLEDIKELYNLSVGEERSPFIANADEQPASEESRTRIVEERPKPKKPSLRFKKSSSKENPFLL